MPTGGVVVIIVDNGGAFISTIMIKPTILDWNKSTGLCGTMNNDATDDIEGPNGELSSNPCANNLANMGYGCRLEDWAQYWRYSVLY